MTSDTHALPIYLQDHIAGAEHAIDLLERMRDGHADDRIGPFANELLTEVRKDFETLKQLSDAVGEGSSGLKNIASRVAEKVGRLKLDDGGRISFETFESLEFLVLGVHGKLALWRALEVASTLDVRLQGVDYSFLERRAVQQEETIDKERLALARSVFRPEPGPELPANVEPAAA